MAEKTHHMVAISFVSWPDIIFTSASAQITLTPGTAFLEGGVNAVPFVRGEDYEIRFEAGQLRRLAQGTISDPSPSDLVISYSFYPGGIEQNTAYPQTIKPVGVKVEPDVTANFFFYGTASDFSSISGIAVNLELVPRTPSRFSFLAPVEPGNLLLMSYYNDVPIVSAPGCFRSAKPNVVDLVLPPILARYRLSGWEEIIINSTSDENRIAIPASLFDATAQWEFEYYLKFQYTTSPIRIIDPGANYIFLPYSYLMHNAEESMEDVQKVLHLDENRRARLSLPAITDQTLAELERTLASEIELIEDRFWRFIDATTVEVFIGAFSDQATYRLTYKSRKVEFVTPITEQWEYAKSPDGTNFTDFAPINIGDKLLTDNFIRVRVTSFGDFAVQDYRVRAMAGIADTSELSGCGFGIEPFGLLPFGDCMATAIEEEAIQSKRPSGRLGLSGNLTITSHLLATVAFVSTGGSLFFSGTKYYSLTTKMIQTSTPGGVNMQLPSAINLKNLWIRMDPASAGTVTAKFVVNDTPSNAIVVTISAGTTIGSATGDLALQAGDQLCVQIVGASNVFVNSLSARYTIV